MSSRAVDKIENRTTRTRPRHKILAAKIVENEEKPPTERLSKMEILTSVGYSTSVARDKAMRVFSTEGLRTSLLELGFSPKKLLTVGSDAMQAKKGAFFRGDYKEVDSPDHQTRLQGAHYLADVLGLKKIVTENHNVNVHIDASELTGLID